MKKLFFSIVAVLMMSAGAFAAKNDDGVANPQAVRA
jgi:hypothetical protein